MNGLLLEVTALGIAVALTSPGSVVTVIALLSMSTGVRRGVAFIAGWILAISVIAVLMVVVLQGQNFRDRHTDPSEAASWVEILLGCLLLVVGVRMYRRRHYAPKTQSQPKWLARLDRSHWSLEIVVGAVMLSYALTLTAAAETLKAHVGTVDAVAAGIVFAAASIITIAAPLVVASIAPERAARDLTAWRNWLLAHARWIVLIAVVLVGAALIVRGGYDLTA
jgi:hypothetical protein